MIMKRIERELSVMTRTRVKCVEEGGAALEHLLCTSEIKRIPTCTRTRCQVCTFDESKGNCRQRSVTYEGKCLICEKQGDPHRYYGETSLSLAERAKQHVGEAEKFLDTSHIWQHIIMLKHLGGFKI